MKATGFLLVANEGWKVRNVFPFGCVVFFAHFFTIFIFLLGYKTPLFLNRYRTKK